MVCGGGASVGETIHAAACAGGGLALWTLHQSSHCAPVSGGKGEEQFYHRGHSDSSSSVSFFAILAPPAISSLVFAVHPHSSSPSILTIFAVHPLRWCT
jgi:hypothetical protein